VDTAIKGIDSKGFDRYFYSVLVIDGDLYTHRFMIHVLFLSLIAMPIFNMIWWKCNVKVMCVHYQLLCNSVLLYFGTTKPM